MDTCNQCASEPRSVMAYKNHVYDGIQICLNCDYCRDPECCPQTLQCEGNNWDFMERSPAEWLEKYPVPKEEDKDE